VLGRGTLEFLHPENRKVLVFVRKYQEEKLLVVANLSRFVQAAEVDLSEYKGLSPVELFGHSEFPPIGDQPYLIALSPHASYWLSLEAVRSAAVAGEKPAEVPAPVLAVDGWEDVFTPAVRDALAKSMPAFLRARHWFAGKARKIRATQIGDVLKPRGRSHMILVDVEYGEGEPETYLIPVTVVVEDQAKHIDGDAARIILARLCGPDGREGVLCAALYDKEFGQDLLDAIARRRRFRGERGDLIAVPTASFRRAVENDTSGLDPTVLKTEHHNSVIVYGDRFVLKLYRKLQPGINPDLEIGYHLTEKAHFAHVPRVVGALEYRRDGETMTTGILMEFVRNQGDAWKYTLDALSGYFEAAVTRREQAQDPPHLDVPSIALVEGEVPEQARELIGAYLESAKLLGRRTAELHLALSRDSGDPAFEPEPFTDFDRQSLYHGMLGQVSRSMVLLRQRLKSFVDPTLSDARKVLALEPDIRKRFQAIHDRRLDAVRIRCHGDYGLHDVLFTGKDFCILDFEGEPTRSISERRIKRSPVRDVACMLRSFEYASLAVLYGEVPGVIARREDWEALDVWARYWTRWVGAAFLGEYLRTAGDAPFLPKSRESLAVMLLTFVLDKAMSEVVYEINNRPNWLRIPLRGILQVMEVPSLF
jgi:maltose alpha-D-glucosyltransferase/alpha-amylase